MAYIRKYNKKPTMAKKKKVYKKRVSKPRVMKVSDPTVERLTAKRQAVYYCTKSLQVNRPYATTTAGTCGFQIAWQGTAFSSGYNILFDPSGNFGTNSGLASSSTVIGSAAQIPDWPNLKSLYALYKVNKITLQFSLSTVGNQQTMPMVLYMRYLNEYAAITPTLNTMASENNWIKKTFTDENPTFKYSFVPKVAMFQDNQSLPAIDSRKLGPMGWTSTAYPAELYGFKLYMDYPATASADFQFISCDITYHMSFKENT